MSAPALQPQRVRCRQIRETDLAALAALLAHGFPRSTEDYWREGFARFAALAPIEGMPRFGYVLEGEGALVGVLLLISSARSGRIYSNLSSWYVEPDWRAHSTLLVSMATKRKDVTFINASPAPHTWRTLTAQNFHPYNFGRSAVFPVLGFGGGRVSEEIPSDLPERDMLLAHREMGCVSLVCDKDGEMSPFIFKHRLLDRLKVKMWELIYCRSNEDFARCGAALGRFALARGRLGFIVDGRIDGMIGHYVAGKEPRFYKGSEAPPLNDLAFTEKVVFG